MIRISSRSRASIPIAYDAQVFWADGDFAATYLVSPDGSAIALLCFLNGHPVCIIFQRMPETGGGT